MMLRRGLVWDVWTDLLLSVAVGISRELRIIESNNMKGTYHPRSS
jgi:hypothetical protein